jgi:hypothetical protein
MKKSHFLRDEGFIWRGILLGCTLPSGLCVSVFSFLERYPRQCKHNSILTNRARVHAKRRHTASGSPHDEAQGQTFPRKILFPF